jgi:RNA polymerase sigma factor (sigma-70 family)
MNYDDAIYRQVEEMVKPIVESNARRFAVQLGMTVDEARQEARYGLMEALREYNYNSARGGIYNYVKTAVRRHFLKLWATARAQKRRPHVFTIDDKTGRRVAKPVPFVDHSARPDSDFMDTLMSPTDQFPAADVLIEQADRRRASVAFMKALEASLAPRDLEVLRCKYDPPRGLRMLMLDELAIEPTIPLIGKYLQLSKNEVDWALRRIREKALELLVAEEFSDLGDLSLVRPHGG